MNAKRLGTLEAEGVGKETLAFAKERREKRGRPKSTNRTVLFVVRLHPEAIQAARDAAHDARKSIGPWVEAALLEAVKREKRYNK